MNARSNRIDSRNDYPPAMRGLSLADNERWCGVIRHCLQIPLQRLTDRERFELLSCLGKLNRTAEEFLPTEARSLRCTVQDKLTHETADALAEVLAGHALANWTRWTTEAQSRPNPDLLREMLIALDDTEAAVAVVAGLHPHSIPTELDELLSRCRSWIEIHGTLFAPLRAEVERFCKTLQPDLTEEDYDLAVSLHKFESILDPIPEDGPIEPAPFTMAMLDALLQRPT